MWQGTNIWLICHFFNEYKKNVLEKPDDNIVRSVATKSLKWIEEWGSLNFGGGGLIESIFKLSLIKLHKVKYLYEMFDFFG